MYLEAARCAEDLPQLEEPEQDRQAEADERHRLVHARHERRCDEQPDLYEEGHIPGAVKLHWREDLQDPVERDLVDRETFERLLGGRGISNDTTLVLYGDKNNWFAAYAYWYLKIYGHGDARILDGGRQKWIDEGRELTTDAPAPRFASYTAHERDESIRARRDVVLAAIGDGGRALVDVRSPQEYSGDLIAPPGYEQEGAQRAGHIPGAASVPWAQAVKEDGTFKSADELRELYSGKGVVDGHPIIAYCRIGERSSHTWFVLKYLLGVKDVKNYDGSWTEWGNLIGAPIETGEAPARAEVRCQ